MSYMYVYQIVDQNLEIGLELDLFRGQILIMNELNNKVRITCRKIKTYFTICFDYYITQCNIY